MPMKMGKNAHHESHCQRSQPSSLRDSKVVSILVLRNTSGKGNGSAMQDIHTRPGRCAQVQIGFEVRSEIAVSGDWAEPHLPEFMTTRPLSVIIAVSIPYALVANHFTATCPTNFGNKA